MDFDAEFNIEFAIQEGLGSINFPDFGFESTLDCGKPPGSGRYERYILATDQLPAPHQNQPSPSSAYRFPGAQSFANT